MANDTIEKRTEGGTKIEAEKPPEITPEEELARQNDREAAVVLVGAETGDIEQIEKQKRRPSDEDLSQLSDLYDSGYTQSGVYNNFHNIPHYNASEQGIVNEIFDQNTTQERKQMAGEVANRLKEIAELIGKFYDKYNTPMPQELQAEIDNLNDMAQLTYLTWYEADERERISETDPEFSFNKSKRAGDTGLATQLRNFHHLSEIVRQRRLHPLQYQRELDGLQDEKTRDAFARLPQMLAVFETKLASYDSVFPIPPAEKKLPISLQAELASHAHIKDVELELEKPQTQMIKDADEIITSYNDLVEPLLTLVPREKNKQMERKSRFVQKIATEILPRYYKVEGVAIPPALQREIDNLQDASNYFVSLEAIKYTGDKLREDKSNYTPERLDSMPSYMRERKLEEQKETAALFTNEVLISRWHVLNILERNLRTHPSAQSDDNIIQRISALRENIQKELAI